MGSEGYRVCVDNHWFYFATAKDTIRRDDAIAIDKGGMAVRIPMAVPHCITIVAQSVPYTTTKVVNNTA